MEGEGLLADFQGSCQPKMPLSQIVPKISQIPKSEILFFYINWECISCSHVSAFGIIQSVHTYVSLFVSE